MGFFDFFKKKKIIKTKVGRYEISDPARIKSMLVQIQEDHRLLDIEITNEKDRFNSIIISVDKNMRYFSVDELMPRAGHTALQKNKQIKIFSQLRDGASFTVSANLDNVDEKDGVAFYRMHFPKKAIYRQRRSIYRAPVSAAKKYAFRAHNTESGGFIQGTLLDISSEGVGVLLKNSRVKIPREDVLHGCSLKTPNGQEIRFNITVKRCSNGLLGGQFFKIDKVTRAKIHKIATALRRDEIQRDKTR